MNELFNKNGFAIEDCQVPVYNFDKENNEYISASMEYVVKGSGIPAYSTLNEPLLLKEGYTQVFNEEKQNWEYVEDYRNEDVYNINTHQKEDIKYIGALKPEHTLLAPPSYNHEFIDGEWIITEEKQAELDKLELERKCQQLRQQIQELTVRIQEHMLMGETEEARELIIQKRKLEEKLNELTNTTK